MGKYLQDEAPRKSSKAYSSRPGPISREVGSPKQELVDEVLRAVSRRINHFGTGGGGVNALAADKVLIADLLNNYAAPDVEAALAELASASSPAKANDANVLVQITATGSVAQTQHGVNNLSWYLESFGAVGDGVTDDAPAFATAMAGIGSANATLNGSPGKTYLIGAAGITVTSKTSVRIVGNGAKIKLNAVATQTLATFGSTAIAFDTCTNVEFSGWDIDGNSKASNIIGMEDCTDCTISNNRTNSGGLNGHIFSVGGFRNSFLFNRLSSGSGSTRGLWIGNTNTIEPETDPLIMGNVVRSMPATGIGGCHFGGRIIGNYSVSNGGAGIVTAGANATGIIGHGLVISGNTCNSNTFHGIQMGDITGWATSADSIYDLTVQGNHCEGNTQSGIYAVQVRNSTVSGNVCVNNLVNGVTAGQAIDVTFANNVCYDSRSAGSRTQDNGLYIVAETAALDISRVTVTGNICYNHTQHGIQINTSGAGTMSNVVVTANVCNANSIDGIIAAGSGSSITRLNVTGNICAGNTTADLRVDPLDAVISDNLYTTSSNIVYWTFTDADTTPSVLGNRKLFLAPNTGATNVTTFDDGVSGQQIIIYASTANTTLVNGTLILKGGVNSTMPQNGFITLIFTGALWFEVSRSY